jgi:flagellar hook assembly protein FlgD
LRKAAAYSVSLAQNYPNPFNPTTAISYQLSAVSAVTLGVYDLLGREIATLVSDVQSAGSHVARWNGRNYRGELVASGMYLYQLRVGSLVITRKMVFMK